MLPLPPGLLSPGLLGHGHGPGESTLLSPVLGWLPGSTAGDGNGDAGAGEGLLPEGSSGNGDREGLFPMCSSGAAAGGDGEAGGEGLVLLALYMASLAAFAWAEATLLLQHCRGMRDGRSCGLQVSCEPSGGAACINSHLAAACFALQHIPACSCTPLRAQELRAPTYACSCRDKVAAVAAASPLVTHRQEFACPGGADGIFR